MVKASLPGLMASFIKASLLKIESQEKEHTDGLIKVFTKARSKTDWDTVLVNSRYKTQRTKENGMKAKKKVKEESYSKVAAFSKDNF